LWIEASVEHRHEQLNLRLNLAIATHATQRQRQIVAATSQARGECMRRPQPWPQFVDGFALKAESGAAILQGEPAGPYRDAGAEIEQYTLDKGYSSPFLIDDNKMGCIAEV
jgi:hypothetical protein